VMDSLGHKLRALRGDIGLNQEQMAARVGITQSAVSKIENGTRMPSRQVIEAWVGVCGKTMEIAGLPEVSDAERELLDAAAEVNPDDLYLLSEALRGLAVVKGKDREHARSMLEWLASRAPSAVDGEMPESATIAPKPAARVRQ
jgi:transcriptional regulator with XRE-family HTH domain